MRLEGRPLALNLRRPFVISTGRWEHLDNLLCTMHVDGVTGYGEGAPQRGEGPNSLKAALAQVNSWAGNEEVTVSALQVAERVPGASDVPSAQCALSLAFLDAAGRKKSRPLHRLLNLPDGEKDTSITLSLGPIREVLEEAKVRDEEGWPVFKVKLGGDHDEEVVSALRDRYPEKRLRVDANGAWSPQKAAALIPKLGRLEVEFVEQPLPPAMESESAQLAKQSDVPIILDEALRTMDDALRLVAADAGDGGNIKLAKCGGPWEARRIVKFLRDSDWKVMVGCMIESSLGIAAAAAFAGSVDYLDLDAHQLIRDDPFSGFATPNGRVVTPEGNGIGVEPIFTRLG